MMDSLDCDCSTGQVHNVSSVQGNQAIQADQD